jgi:hypothetical protein
MILGVDRTSVLNSGGTSMKLSVVVHDAEEGGY